MKPQVGDVPRKHEERLDDRALCALAAAAGANAFAKPVIVALADPQTCLQGDCAVRFVVLFCTVVGMALILAGRRAPRLAAPPPARPCGGGRRIAIWSFTAATGLLLTPFAMGAWLALAVAGLLGRVCAQCPRRRAGYAILFVCAARAPLGALFLGPLAGAALAIDAAAAGLLSGALGDAVSIDGNLLRKGGHSVLILTGCSSYANVCDAFILWFALTRPLGILSPKPFALIAGLLCASVFLVNLTRLAAMAQSPEAFAYFHDAEGADLISAAYAIAIASAVFAGARAVGR